MYVYNDDGRSLEFRDADDLKTFLLEEYAPALLAKALAKDAFDRACTMGFDDADDYIGMCADALLGKVTMEDILGEVIESCYQNEEIIELADLDIEIGYTED